MKQCTKCKECKPLEEFNKQSSSKDGLSIYCRECLKKKESDYKRSYIGLINRMYGNQKTNSRRRGSELPDYSIKELREWVLRQDIYKSLYDEWVDSGYNRMKVPSCDRRDPTKGYTLSNLVLTDWQSNKTKGELEVRYLQIENSTLLHGGHRPVVQSLKDGTDIATYLSQAEAARCTNSDQANISSCCAGRLNSHNGYKWRYANDMAV